MNITNIRSKRAAESRIIAVNFSDKLSGIELLSGTPAVAEVDTSALTISGVNRNSVATNIGGIVAAIDRAVIFRVAGGTAGNTYRIRVTVSTDADAPQALIREISLRVN